MGDNSRKIMSEFFLELFSEEIPANLQQSTRKILLENFTKLFKDKNVTFGQSFSYSVPNRLIILFHGLADQILEKKDEIRGPNINAPEKAVSGFLRSNNITKEKIFIKNTEKGEFYFFNKPEKKFKTHDFLEENIPHVLKDIKWKKSMKWADHEVHWGRPLKSILATFNSRKLEFKYYHIESSNFTYLDKELESKKKVFKDFKSYSKYLKNTGLIINHNERRDFIKKTLLKESQKKNLRLEINEKLLQEVTDLVEQPKILSCKFDKKFLQIPREILIITMEHHQKYFPTFDNKNNISNEFFVVANNDDKKGFIKSGNERVVEARLSDADFFWKKNKSQNLLKQVSKLRNVNYFKGLGNYFDKVQRIRKLSGQISDDLLISKEKVEIAASICKVDLLSDLVGEFPELQGILGGYFADFQGFDKDICLAIREQYLPIGTDSKIPKKKYSIALSLGDKIDTLVGFFGIGLKPSSSKDPFALRRLAIGLIKIILENKIKLKIKDLIISSCRVFNDQSIEFDIKKVQTELVDFLKDRFKNYMKESEIRYDIIESSTLNLNIDNILEIYQKANILNKIINKPVGQDILFIYKRVSNILVNEIKNHDFEVKGITDPGLFKNDFEKKLYKKIKYIKKDFSSIAFENNYQIQLETLSSAKNEVEDFFNNVIVNDNDMTIKKNRLELLKMLCKTFDNYLNFSIVEGKSEKTNIQL